MTCQPFVGLAFYWKSHMKNLIFSGLLLIGVAATAQPKQKPQSLVLKPQSIRRETPPLHYKLADGGTGEFSDLKGKVVYVDFLTGKDERAVVPLEKVKELYKTYHDKGVEFVFISLEINKDDWRDAVKKYALPGVNGWAVFDDPVLDAMNVMELPHYMVLDKKGYVWDLDAKSPDKIATTFDMLLEE